MDRFQRLKGYIKKNLDPSLCHPLFPFRAIEFSFYYDVPRFERSVGPLCLHTEAVAAWYHSPVSNPQRRIYQRSKRITYAVTVLRLVAANERQSDKFWMSIVGRVTKYGSCPFTSPHVVPSLSFTSASRPVHDDHHVLC